jgi:hypothetical protein
VSAPNSKPPPSRLRKPSALQAAIADRLRSALTEAHGIVAHAARILGIDRKQLYRGMKRHGLTAWARGLRDATGLRPRGRPPNSYKGLDGVASAGQTGAK